MTVYRASPKDGVAWITGGTSGIGRAVALELLRRGYKVAVTAHSFDLLEQWIAERPEWHGYRDNIFKYACDVTDGAAMAQTVASIIADHGAISLALLNAGTYAPVDGSNLQFQTFRNTLEVNYMGVINGLIPVVEHMKARGKGHVAITGSVTSYAGLPTAAAYGPTKAALNSLAQSLKFDFDRMNIRLQIINPGFVRSELTARNAFKMPGIINAWDAARRIARGFERGGFEIRFPRRLVWPLSIVSLLPYPLYFWIVKKITGFDKPLT